MKIKTFYPIWYLIFLLGAIWNILCITVILPLKLHYLSFAVIMLASVASIIMSSCMAKQEAHKRSDKIKNPLFGLFLCLAAAWLVTFIACCFAA